MYKPTYSLSIIIVLEASSSFNWSMDICCKAFSSSIVVRDFAPKSESFLGTAPLKLSTSSSNLELNPIFNAPRYRLKLLTDLKLVSLVLPLTSASKGPVLSHSGLLWLEETPFWRSRSISKSLDGEVIPLNSLHGASLAGDPLLPQATSIYLV